jgi:ectoine hydroxylase-related dioxygenase (phytanoyl-CoA dioxygenase family)
MHSLSDEDVRFYVDQGYLVVPNVFSSKDIREINDDIVRFARGIYPIVNRPELPANACEEQVLAQMLAVHFPHWVSPVMRRTVDEPRMAAVVQRIAGAHLPHWDGSAKCMQSMLFIKPPDYPGQAWHQDERYIPTRDRSLVGVWIALDDATVENGCLRVLPGSQRPGVLYPTRDHLQPDEFDFSDEAYGFDGSAEVTVEVRAGSLVCFNGYLLHRSRRNRSHGYRRALVNHYCTASTLLPWVQHGKQIASEEIARLDNRMVVPIGPDPYADSGYLEPPGQVFLRPCSAGRTGK